MSRGRKEIMPTSINQTELALFSAKEYVNFRLSLVDLFIKKFPVVGIKNDAEDKIVNMLMIRRGDNGLF